MKTWWKWRLVADYIGAPEFPVALMDRIRELASRDIDAQHFADSLDVIQAIHDLYKLAYATDSAERILPLDISLEGPAIERLALGRDEAANVVWAIEDTLADELGLPVTVEHTLWIARDDHNGRGSATSGTLADQLLPPER